MSVFKGEVIEIEPIWNVRPSRTVQIKDFEIIKCIGTGGNTSLMQVSLRSFSFGRRAMVLSMRSS